MHRSSNGNRAWILTAALGAGAVALAGSLVCPTPARAADEAGAKFFESKIRPILAQNCVGCHGEEKQKGDLRLDTRENLLKGGKDGDKVVKVVEPGNPDKSMIIEAIGYKNEDMQMPPPKKNKQTGKTEDKKLTDAQIADMKEWVKMGVPYGDKPVVAEKK
jgi:mono/diheme cytochrome c family protein